MCETPQPLSCMHNHLCSKLGEENKPHGCVEQSPKMEHHLRWDKGRLIEVYDKPKPEMTMETEVASAAPVWRMPEHGKCHLTKDT